MKTLIFVDFSSWGSSWVHLDSAGTIVLAQTAQSHAKAEYDSGLLDEAQRFEWFKKYGDYELIDTRKPIPARAREAYEALQAQRAILRSPL